MKKLLIASLLVFSGCGDKNRPKEPTAPVEKSLIEVSKDYCDWSKSEYKKNQYVHSRCDGSGFTSLYSLMCDDVDLSVFEDNGKLYRSPGHDCYIADEKRDNGAKSESSRDMYLMRLIAAFEKKDLGYIERVISYGKKHKWVMCKGKGIDGLNRCIMSPQLILLHYDAIKSIKGESVRLSEENHIDLPLLDGFEAHLEVIKIWLSGRIYDGVSDRQLDRLERYAKREDRNALFNAIFHSYKDGDFSQVKPLLDFYPRNELPSTKQYCTEYLWQRDQNSSSWEPCQPIEFHSGTDFNFAVYIMTQ